MPRPQHHSLHRFLSAEPLEDRSVPALVAAFGFEEASGTTAVDSSTANNPGTLNGAVRAAGRYGQGLSFNGTNSWVTVNDAASLRLTTGMTLSAWVYPTAVDGYETVLLKERGTTGLTYSLYAADGAGRPPAGYVYRNGDQSAVGASALPLNTWSHLAVTYNASALRLYVNGAQVASRNQTGAMPTTAGPLRIGGNSVWGEYFSGLIDEVRVYNNALTQAEIQTDMNTPVVPTSPDTTPPTVSVTTPTNGATVSGAVTLTAAASDNVGVSGVRFYVDGTQVGAEDTTAPYSITWDSTNSLGTHQITAVARDAAGNTATSSAVSVTVVAPSDTTPPTVSVTSPNGGATVSGAVSVTASASDDVGVVGVQFYLDGVPLGAEDIAAPYAVTWDTTATGNGAHSLTARARDAAGNATTSAAVSVTVSNAADPSVVGQWSPVMNWPLVAINSVLLKDGRMLMWDGYPADGALCIGSTSARVWDPATNTFTPVPIPYFTGHEDDIFCSAQTVMADGRVLVVGGHDCDGPGYGIRMVNIFDPATMTWTRGPDMAYRRWYPTATTLADGRVLVLGGSDMTTVDYIEYPEVYNPVTNTWTTLTSARLAVPSYSFVFQNPDGRVIVAGSDEAKMATYALNVSTQTWAVVDPAVLDAGSGVMYSPGKIMKAGSSYLSAPADNGGNVPSAATSYTLDLTQAGATWQQGGSMANPRTHLNMTLLPDDTVLATGGSRDIGGLTSSRAVYPAELWSPVTRTWTTLSSMQTPRMYHSTATLLPDGRVVVAGGGRLSPATDYFNAEIYSPAYLFKGARPTITSAPTTLAYGGEFFVATPDGASVASAALIRNTSVTHSINMDQRYVPLTFRVVAGGLMVTAPADSRTATPGHYMLFLVNAAGVPAVAPIVRLPAGYEDTAPPTAPTDLTATAVSEFNIALSWSAASDNVGVVRYNVHRSTSPNFTPSAANRVGQTAGLSYTDAGLPTGTFYYLVTAEDAAGNVGPASNQASATVAGDTTPPTVSITAPSGGTTVSGSVSLTAAAGDNVGVVGVQFYLNGVPLGAEDTAAPYSITWNTGGTPNGTYTLTAVARDAAGNTTTSDAVSVTVNNTSAPGLVAAWGFEEASGSTTADATGNGQTGTLSGATRVNGRYGRGLSFNGGSAMVSVADTALLHLTSGMTLSAWVLPATTSGWRTVMLKETTGGLAYSLYASGDGTRPSGYVHVGSNDQSVIGTAALSTTAWNYLAVTYDGANLRLYVNGTLVTSRAQSGAIATSTGAFRIGGNTVWGEYFNGLIDEVRVYNRALTATEIGTDMNTPVGGGSPLRAAELPRSGGAAVLTPTDLRAMADAAKRNWAAVGLTPAQAELLARVQFLVTDLNATGKLGEALAGTPYVLIDDDAAGFGWYVDPTPADTAEFPLSVAPTEWATVGGPAAGRYDLLTVLTHELGHILGLVDLDPAISPHDLMSDNLPTGTRRLPAVADLGVHIGTPSAPPSGPDGVPTPTPSSVSNVSADSPWRNLDTTGEQESYRSDPKPGASLWIDPRGIWDRKAGRVFGWSADEDLLGAWVG